MADKLISVQPYGVFLPVAQEVLKRQNQPVLRMKT